MKKQPTLIFALPEGFEVLRGFVGESEQREMVEKCRELCRITPLYTPRNEFSEFNVKLNSFGDYGWFSDRNGFRYLDKHPHVFCPQCEKWTETGYQCAVCKIKLIKRKFAPIPEIVRCKMLEAATKCKTTLRLETVLMNYYMPGRGKLGKHKDDTEEDKTAAIITICLGDDCLFGIGGEHYGEAVEYLVLKSGDVVVMSGKSRLYYHEVAGIIPNTSNLLEKGGRISLTGRQVKSSS
ncbi:MAG TPA: alpha-ketoglutarate-dependent dioxygenase AlkB [Pyrinomonadaceae bacterium]|nr:alpha-ketoglutarate-dependent dioxygenase AlkB [Pyrinomonadaceae bacterium]